MAPKGDSPARWPQPIECKQGTTIKKISFGRLVVTHDIGQDSTYSPVALLTRPLAEIVQRMPLVAWALALQFVNLFSAVGAASDARSGRCDTFPGLEEALVLL